MLHILPQLLRRRAALRAQPEPRSFWHPPAQMLSRLKTAFARPSPVDPKRGHVLALSDYPFRTSETLRFADTDRNGHISNAVFAVCCQNARMALLLDREHIPLAGDGQFVTARLDLEFLHELQWPGTVEVGTCVLRVGRSSLSLAQALFVAGRCVAYAQSTVVLIDAATRRPLALPSETRAALLQLSGPSENTPQHHKLV